AIHMKARRLSYRIGFSPFKELPRDREIVTYCACPNDEIAVRGAQVFQEAGFKRVRVLKGGWQAWLKAGGPVESKPKVELSRQAKIMKTRTSNSARREIGL